MGKKKKSGSKTTPKTPKRKLHPKQPTPRRTPLGMTTTEWKKTR